MNTSTAAGSTAATSPSSAAVARARSSSSGHSSRSASEASSRRNSGLASIASTTCRGTLTRSPTTSRSARSRARAACCATKSASDPVPSQRPVSSVTVAGAASTTWARSGSRCSANFCIGPGGRRAARASPPTSGPCASRRPRARPGGAGSRRRGRRSPPCRGRPPPADPRARPRAGAGPSPGDRRPARPARPRPGAARCRSTRRPARSGRRRRPPAVRSLLPTSPRDATPYGEHVPSAPSPRPHPRSGRFPGRLRPRHNRDGAGAGATGGRVDGVLAVDALVPVFVVALLAPIVVGLAPRLPVPQVVLLLLGGILIGPDVLGLSSPGGVQVLADVGLGFVFLLAGYEVDLRLFRRGCRTARRPRLVRLPRPGDRRGRPPGRRRSGAGVRAGGARPDDDGAGDAAARAAGARPAVRPARAVPARRRRGGGAVPGRWRSRCSSARRTGSRRWPPWRGSPSSRCSSASPVARCGRAAGWRRSSPWDSTRRRRSRCARRSCCSSR